MKGDKRLTISVNEAAKLLGMSPQGLREHIKRGRFKDFAECFKSLQGNRYIYKIYKIPFYKHIGMVVPDVVECA